MREVWVIDDDPAIRWVLEKSLQREQFVARTFSASSDLFEALKQHAPDVLITDIRMPDISGLELLKKVKQQYPQLPVIVTTAFNDLDSTVNAFHDGAFDYLSKPFDVQEMIGLVKRACETIKPETNVEPSHVFKSHAKAMAEIFRAIGRLAPSKATVLITGESGSGKELIAKSVHEHSLRNKQAFIALNAAAIPRDLLEAELFGHEKGSFTGANVTRKGRFEEANGGTLFLDEIGDMPLELQTRLLRVLSEGSFYRVGGTQPIKVDVRIIAATHQPLEDRVKQGLFREDLFHRLNVIRLRVPPLRERKEDIPQLVNYFIQQAAMFLEVPIKQVSADAMNALMAFSFPGNVRQLENFCQSMMVLSSGSVIQVSDLPQEVLAHQEHKAVESKLTEKDVSASQLPTIDNTLSLQGQTWQTLLAETVREQLQLGRENVMAALTMDFEKTVLNTAIEVCQGKKINIAQRLGMGRNTVSRKLKELEIKD
ncbi:nitrogen regulation protein NR(I) [Basilea psittacipulmonis]|uniref:DNA-binding transcriptional regulator NtrC n=1 Tax=Basilea psittacipulmonis DSM 24701 TaxID=1072685 RepID=A0A077DF00_9BURK|nr:nitrogen regulation protein NR(I) [Basilea psittacipulmonis]AIL32711.1 chemotaxis protein CheY [Basilea psittacipulmonis DSM 24701]